MKELYLVWHSYISKEYLLIGYLRKEENGYSFEYNVEEAFRAYYEGCFLPFKVVRKPYYSADLFPFFKERVMDPKRHSLNKYLQKFKLHNYDEFTILSLTGGIKNSDNFLTLTPESYQKVKNQHQKHKNSIKKR